MGGLFSRETDCMKECKLKCAEQKNNSNSGNETKKQGLMDSVKGKLGEATNAVKNKLGVKSPDPNLPPSNAPPSNAPPPSNGPPSNGPLQQSPMSGGYRKGKSRRKRTKRRKIRRLSKSKRSHKKK